MNNPFPPLQANLREALARHELTTESTQLIVISVILGLSLAGSLISWALRIRYKTFFLFRVVSGYILPAGSNCWLICSIIFGFISQAYIYQPRVSAATLNIIVTLDTLVWLPIWVGRWILTWATAVAAIQVISPTRSGSRLLPAITNIFFITIPIFSLTPLIIFSVLAQEHDIKGYQLFYTLDSALTEATLQFSAGTYDVKSTFISDLFKELAVEFSLSADWLRKVWINWAVLTAVEGLLFIAVSIIYLRSIFQSMALVRQNSSLGSVGKLSSLSKALKGLLFSSVASIIVSIAHLSSVVYLAIGTGSTEYPVLVVLWAYAIAGAFCGSLAILVRSFDDSGLENSRTGNRKSSAFFRSKSQLESSKAVQVVVSYQVGFDRAESELELDSIAKAVSRDAREIEV